MSVDAIPWSSRAWAAIEDLAATGRAFSSDDLVDLVGLPDPDHEPNARNGAVGAIFRQASTAGLIRPTGRVVTSRQPHRRGGTQRTWVGA